MNTPTTTRTEAYNKAKFQESLYEKGLTTWDKVKEAWADFDSIDIMANHTSKEATEGCGSDSDLTCGDCGRCLHETVLLNTFDGILCPQCRDERLEKRIQGQDEEVN